MAEQIKTTVKKDGFEGILYPGDRSKDKVLIVVSGSNGGMKMTAEIAGFYNANGIPALAVAMFNTKQTINGLVRVPLEYVECAIKWLKEQGYQKIGIDGTSKGSEYALLCASYFQDISCVIARVPSYFVSEGLANKGKSKSPSGTSCWSYRRKELPFAAYKTRNINLVKHVAYPTLSHIMLTDAGFVYKYLFCTERRNKEACAREREQLKEELLSWVDSAWREDKL